MAAGGRHPGQHSDPRSAAEEDRILVRLALKHRMVTQDQIDQAVAYQQQERAQGESPTLADALVHLHLISPGRLKLLLRAQTLAIHRKPDHLFARIALRNGVITQDHIDDAVRHQTKVYKETGEFRALGDLLHERGLISGRHHKAINAAIARCGQSPSKTCSSIEVPENEQARNGGKADQEGQSEPAPAEPYDFAAGSEIEESDFELQVSPDGLTAFLVLNKELPPRFRSQDLLTYLRAKGIAFGIPDAETLLESIRSEWEPGRTFEVARGIPPELSRSAEIQVLIDPELHGYSAQDQGAVDIIDLKDRGMIPQVRKGDFLARKTPLTPGIDGIDVFGQEIPVRVAKDLPLLVGSGVELSHDRLQAVAKVDGRPQISAYGRISVLPELVIRGDVSFETGNIDFAGSIIVGGVVQDGFKVRGGSLIASEVGKAEIDIEGDVWVYGGVLGARVRSQASVKAMHIHASHIEAMGDVVAERGIVDSRISTSGKCISRRGTILSSSIVARRGIEAQHIGSDRSKPCALGIGFDPIAERQAEACKAMLAVEREEAARQSAHIGSLKPRLADVERKIGELAQEQDRAIRQQRSYRERISDAEEAGFAEEAESLRGELAVLDGTIHDLERNLDGFLEQQDQLKSAIAEQKDRIREIEDRIAQLTAELSVITDWAAAGAKRPVVKAHGNIFAGTSIKGPFASVTLKENYRGVAFGERASTEEGEGPGGGAPRIAMQRLKR